MPFLRPKKFSRDSSSTLDVVQHTIHYLQKVENYTCLKFLESSKLLDQNSDQIIESSKLLDRNSDQVNLNFSEKLLIFKISRNIDSKISKNIYVVK